MNTEIRTRGVIVLAILYAALLQGAKLVITQNTEAIPPMLELSGSATAARASGLNGVSTQQRVCTDPNLSPAACATQSGTSLFELTAHTLAQPIPIVAGQIVQVKVSFRFF